jgi:YfiH family protein
MEIWNWQTWQGAPYLTCSLLNSFPHGFFTQQFSPRSPLELTEVIQAEAEAYRVRQVHGNVVLTPTEIGMPLQRIQQANLGEADQDPLDRLPPGDGVISDGAAQAVWVCTADCVPVLIADQVTGQVAAIHAGWRGTAAKIVPEAIARLQQQGSQLSDLLVAMGPAIAGTVYQVSTTVAAQVGVTVLKEAEWDEKIDQPESILDRLCQLPDSPVLSDPEPGRVRLDVRRVNALQLQQLGLHADQIAIAPYCTYQHTEHFFSYRRERLKQVQWSGIASVGVSTVR